jgi:hypothetical protein
MERIKISSGILTLLILLVFILSCEEKLFTGSVNCEECYTEKPDSVDLVLHWSKNSKFPEIPILLYQGTIDAGEFIDTFYLFGNPAQIWVKAEKEYSVKAIYETDNRTVFVVDGIKQKLKHVTDYCDENCWVTEDVDLYIELKY